MTVPQRKPNRLKDYDYSSPGAYFITICTRGKKNILSRIVGGGDLDVPYVELLPYGEIIDKNIVIMNGIYKNVKVTEYVIMPNHIHMMVEINDLHGASGSPPPTSANSRLSTFVAALKKYCTSNTGEKFFQRSFYDHVIRDQQDYQKIINYIKTNPARWKQDKLYIPD